MPGWAPILTPVLHADEMATIWVIRGGNRHRLVQKFLTDSVIGLTHPLPDGRTLDRAKAERLLTDKVANSEAEAKQFLSFVRRMNVGDVAALLDPAADGLAIGVIAGDYEFDDTVDENRAQHRRPVEWRRRLPFAALPERLAHVPHQRTAVQDVADGRLRDLALQCCRLELGDDPLDRPRGAPPRSSMSGPRRAPAPKRPPKATIPERRCANCFVVKPADAFEDGGDWCRDCV